MDKLIQLLIGKIAKITPAPPAPAEPTKLETMLQTYLKKQSSSQQSRLRPVRRNWSDVKCFSFGKTGHSATCCPMLDVTFPFILPGWKAEKTLSGYLMISPKMATDRRRAENEDWSGGRGSPLRSVKMLDPTTRGGGGTSRSPDPRNVMKMDITKSPMDIVENRNVKPMQDSSHVAEKASSDGTAVIQKLKHRRPG